MARRRRHHAGGSARGRECRRSIAPPARANGVAGITPERAIREGETAEEMLNLIEEDEDIAVLVLAAGTGKDGPGPLVTTLSKMAGEISYSGRARARTPQRRRARRHVVSEVSE